MWWRLPAAEWKRLKGDGTKRALHRLACSDEPPGILAFLDGEPVGWCAVAPRERYPRLQKSKVLAPVDAAAGVWSIVCFFVARGQRRTGLTGRLITAAVSFARRQGARIVEAYPLDAGQTQPAAFLYPGLASTFRRAGFTEVARRSASRPVMRKVVRRGRRAAGSARAAIGRS
jgi:GNAT superfamily N-acetyltransferase